MPVADHGEPHRTDPRRTDPRWTDPADRHDRRGSGRPEGRRDSRPHLAGLCWSLVFLTVAIVGITGSYGWLAHPAARWVAAGGIAVIGLGLVLTALPRQSRH